MASPFPFTSGQVLTAAQLNAIGDYTDYSGSITFSNFTLGNGTVDHAYYTQVNDLVHYTGQVTLGSTSAVTGNILISTPVGVSERQRGAGAAVFIDSGVGGYGGQAETFFIGASSFVQMYALNASATYATTSSLSASVPFTWTTGDSFHWTVVYKAA